MPIHKAERRAVPALIGIAGPSSSGKTFSALLLAAGLCPKGKRIGFIDTEKGRGEHYADNPTIMANLPDGYYVEQLNEPYSPSRYYDVLEEFRKAGDFGVVVIDSATHEWEGFGGCADIADNNKLGGTPNWAMAKKEHKRFMRKALTMPFHVIFCLRAQSKTEVTKMYKDGKEKMVFNDLGMQPVQEKNFKYEMLIACMLDPVTKFPIGDSDFHKVPDDLRDLFQSGRYITKVDGQRLAKWIGGGKEINVDLRVLNGEFRTASNDGMQQLQNYWNGLTKAQQKLLESIKEECKQIAIEADRQARESVPQESVEKREFQKPAITPTEVKDEKRPEPDKKGPEKPIAPKDPEPATGSAKAPAGPAAEPVKQPEPAPRPAPKEENPKPAVPAEPKPARAVPAAKEEQPAQIANQEDDIPPLEKDEAHQNAQEIADALTEDEEAEVATVVQDDEEIELL